MEKHQKAENAGVETFLRPIRDKQARSPEPVNAQDARLAKRTARRAASVVRFLLSSL
jgi:hypothetical protein